MNFSSVIGSLWIAFGAILAGICAYESLTQPLLPAQGGTQSFFLVGLFAIAAIVSGTAQLRAKIAGYIGTAIMAMLLLPYIVLYFLFLGYRSSFVTLAYCAAVAIFSLATIYASALRLRNRKI